MTNWREKGYVPDSDEEEDESQDRHQEQQPGPTTTTLDTSLNTQIAGHDESPESSQVVSSSLGKPPISSFILGTAPSPLRANSAINNFTTIDGNGEIASLELQISPAQAASDVAERLSQELQRGLDVCNNVLRSSSPPRSTGSDSPLSSLPSSPSGSISPIPVAQSRSSPPHGIVERVQIQAEEITSVTAQPVRSLRQRAPLQLHPYSLEAAKYQQEWKQRGLRPVKAPAGPDTQRQHAENSATASHNGDTFHSSQEPLDAARRSADEEDESQSPGRVRRVISRRIRTADADEDEANSNDELPNIEDIFGDDRSWMNASRHQELPKTLTRRSPPGLGTVRSSPLPSRAMPLPRMNRDSNSASVFNLPPSPPRSRSDSPATTKGTQDQPNIEGPRRPPTPGRSSETRPSKRPIIHVSSSSEATDEENDDERPSSESEEPPAFMQIRRRIKGVLPASWIKLDALKQKPAADRSAVARSPEKRQSKGVARVISPRAGPPTTSLQPRFEYSSESESGEDASEAQTRQLQKLSDVRALFDADDDVLMNDVLEEDTIDRMAPPGPSRTSTKPRKKRQQRLVDTWDALQTIPRGSGAATSRTYQRNSRDACRPQKKRQKRSLPVRLSILDAPDLLKPKSDHQSRFLRIAARSVSKASMPRRQNPNTKFFKLATNADTRDVNSGLDDWREGRVMGDRHHGGVDGEIRRTITAASSRQHQQRGNRAQRSSSDRNAAAGARNQASGRRLDIMQSLKARTDLTLARVLQGRSESVISNPPETHDAPAVALRQQNLGFVSWHGNRAGGGKFWSQNPDSGPAQLQGPAVHQRLMRRTPSGVAHGHRHQEPQCLPEAPALASEAPLTLPSRPKKQRNPHRRIASSLSSDEGSMATSRQAEETEMPAPKDEATALGLRLGTWLMRHSPSITNGSNQVLNDGTPSPPSTELIDTLSGIDIDGIYHDSVIETIDPWPAIGSDFRALLDQSLNAPQMSAQTSAVGLSTLRLFQWLAKKCAWSIPDALLHMLFRQYGKNEMLEIFVQPKLAGATRRITQDRTTATDEEGVTDFEIFLNLVALALEQRSSVLSSTASRRNKILGLVFSLIPNNSRVMNENDAIEHALYMTMINTYALYTTLYSSAPIDCRPRLSQVESLINFATSHAQIRDLAILAWSVMSSTAMRKGAIRDDHRALAEHGRAMLSALVEKTTEAIRSEVSASDSTFHHELVVNNISPVLIQMTSIIKQWTLLASTCAQPEDISPYITPEQLSGAVQILQLLKEYLDKLSACSLRAHKALLSLWRSQGMDLAALELLRSVYSRKVPLLREPAMKLGREVVSVMLQAPDEEDSRLQKMVDIWFSFAKQETEGDFRKWDQYLEPTSSYSFRMLADTTVSQQCAVLFLSKVVSDAPAMFELDPEALYHAWLTAILQASDELRFEHVLTERMLIFDVGALAIEPIKELIRGEGYDEQRLSLSAFKHIRTELLRLVVRAIFRLQFSGPDDSQDLIEDPLNEASGRRLLQTITDSLKKVWINLSNQQRDEGYTELVRTVTQELDVYKYPGLKIDPWFTDAPQFAFPIVKDRLQHFFRRVPGSEPRTVDASLIAAFRQANQAAANTPGQVDWVRTAVAALSCNNVFEDVNQDGTCTMDGRLQVDFIRNVLSEYVQSAFSGGPRQALLAVPVIQILTEVVHELHFRQDLEEEGMRGGLICVCVELLESVCRSLCALANRNLPHRGHITMFSSKLIELGTLCIDRFIQFRRTGPCSEDVEDALRSISEVSEGILRCATEAEFVVRPVWIEGSDDTSTLFTPATYRDFSTSAINMSATAASVREMTRKDLSSALSKVQPPRGMATKWSTWCELGLPSWLGWEDIFFAEGERLALAQAVTHFCAVAAKCTGVALGNEGRIWEDSVYTPAVESADAVEDDGALFEDQYWEAL
ncbi:uncharacterized protein AB675_6729 [Cyphellophora attinorum]|uniref:Protein mms22 n=1 Tax=Cyphellophora attinorum TaxID=1664694 RepID=A0A0N0NQ33_9EURO|nr:uncharacterized protein AB675_6729 [Phialophora attinorum]KPI43441.1 hypothetical protein AB675_6729 [Phialophora attinorum]